MKKYVLLFTLFLSFGLSFAQTKDSLSVEEQEKRKRNIEAGNPFKKFGYTPKIATLSKGKYLEWHDLDSIVRIGSYSFHVKKKDITGYNMDEDKNSESTLRPELTSRWLSPDPLAEEFPSWSPYNFVLNNPIRYIDPDGRAPMGSEWIPGTDGERIYYTQNGLGEVTWSSNTPTNLQELGNVMLSTGKGKEQLDKAINSDDVKVEVIFNTGRREGESGPFGSVTFGTAQPTSFDDSKVTSGIINLYPKAYSDLLGSEYLSHFDKINVDGETFNLSNYSLLQNLSTTFGHEIEHLFDSNSSSGLNRRLGKTTDVEKQPNKVSKEIYQQLDELKK